MSQRFATAALAWVGATCLAGQLVLAQAPPQTQPNRPQNPPENPTPPVSPPREPLPAPPDLDEGTKPTGSGEESRDPRMEKGTPETGTTAQVLRGCLSRQEPAAGAASGGSTKGPRFVLTGATLQTAEKNDRPDATSAREPATRGADREEARSQPGEYELVAASDRVKLADHVGHRVEVTGHPDGTSRKAPSSAMSSGVAASPRSGSTGLEQVPPQANAPQQPASAASATPPLFRVTEVKKVGEGCK